MKRNFNQALLGLTLLFAACSTEELVFPDKVQSETESGAIDVIVKPSDVKVQGTYDKTFVITWPTFSDKIEKVILSYEDAGVPYTKEVTDFSKDLEILASTIGEHVFKFVSVSKDGRQTEPVTIKSTNKGLYIAELSERASFNTEGKFVTIIVPNPLKSTLKVTIDYPSATGILKKVIESADSVILYNFNGTAGTKYTLSIEDGRANNISKVNEYTLVPVNYTTSTQKVFWTPYANSPYNTDYTAVQSIDGAGGLNYTSGALVHTYYIHFTKTRASSSNSLWNTVDLTKPNGPFDLITVKGIDVTFNAWSNNPTVFKLYGINSDRTEVLLNTVTLPAAIASGVVDVPAANNALPFIGFKLEMSRTVTGNFQFCLNEINLKGFPE